LFDNLVSTNETKNRFSTISCLKSLVMISQKFKNYIDCERLLSDMGTFLFEKSSDLICFEVLENPYSSKIFTGSENSQLENPYASCVECLCEFVINKTLDAQKVKSWLHQFDSAIPNGGVSTYMRLGELKELLSFRNSLSDIPSYFNNEQIDLSLSFLDELVVQDLLRGGKPYTPLAHVSEPLDTDIKDNGPLIASDLDQSDIISSETASEYSSLQHSSLVLNDKWREDDEEEIDNMTTKSVVANSPSMTEQDLKTSQLANDLFAGLAVDEFGLNADPNLLTPSLYKHVWDDVSEDKKQNGVNPLSNVKKAVAGLKLHPFGKPSNTKSSHSIWTESFNDFHNNTALEHCSDVSHTKLQDQYWSQSSLQMSTFSEISYDNKQFSREEFKSNLSTSTVDDLTDSETEND